MAGTKAHLICESGALQEGGHGVRFTVEIAGQPHPAFAVRYGGSVRAYLNRCSHRGTELDWEPGAFFDAEERYLVCATHGALYDPASGACVSGPCRQGLVKLTLIEKNSGIYVVASDNERIE